MTLLAPSWDGVATSKDLDTSSRSVRRVVRIILFAAPEPAPIIESLWLLGWDEDLFPNSVAPPLDGGLVSVPSGR